MSTISYEFIEFKAIYTETNAEVSKGNVIEAKTGGEESRVNITISVYYSKSKVENKDLEDIALKGGLTISLKNYGLTFVQSDKPADMPTATKWVNGCTTDYVKKDSSETYQVGDLISFCNENASYTNYNGIYVKGKSEDFYVISDNGDTVSALARYNLMVGSNSTDDYATKFNGLQALSQQDGTYKDYELTFAEKHDENKSGSTYLGYWTNATNKELKVPLEKYVTGYPADVYDENSILYEHVQKYQKYFIDTLSKSSVDMRLIKHSELVSLGCDATKYTCKTDTVITNKREWI